MVESEGKGGAGESVESVWWKLIVFNVPWLLLAVGGLLFDLPLEIWLVAAFAPLISLMVGIALDMALNRYGPLLTFASFCYLAITWGLTPVIFGPRNTESRDLALVDAGFGLLIFMTGLIALNYIIWTMRPLVPKAEARVPPSESRKGLSGFFIVLSVTFLVFPILFLAGAAFRGTLLSPTGWLVFGVMLAFSVIAMLVARGLRRSAGKGRQMR
jgi:hypothetical protein